MQRAGSAVWHGSFKDGSGTISTSSGALSNAPFSVYSRFEGRPGTNPEELIGAAHAGCFSMAFSMVLSEAHLTADSIETTADVHADEGAQRIFHFGGASRDEGQNPRCERGDFPGAGG
jgi:lipoyl-dependent peroxiredoxin